MKVAVTIHAFVLLTAMCVCANADQNISKARFNGPVTAGEFIRARDPFPDMCKGKDVQEHFGGSQATCESRTRGLTPTCLQKVISQYPDTFDPNTISGSITAGKVGGTYLGCMLSRH